MPMAQQLNIPGSEAELKELLDFLYLRSKEAFGNGKRPKFHGLLEVIFSEPVILSAIHKLKGNRGSNTPGSDGRNIRDAILERGYVEVVKDIQSAAVRYSPEPVRRVWIPKPGKAEKRPLGIPAIKDRIIQECIRMVIEPILEAQFFRHSYGFRPMRDAGMAIERFRNICGKTGYSWVVEGDISKFFDTVNHTLLLKRLYGMGIRDRRVLMLIKQMLKAGIMNEIRVNELGTPQGGIISPLLANVYLDALDHFVAREWEDKKTKYPYSRNEHRLRALKTTNLKPAYFIRYADDWVLVTNSRENAVKWKEKIGRYLSETLKLKLSQEKTLITNIRKRTVTFLGFDVKVVTNDGKRFSTRTYPNRKRLEAKLKIIKRQLRLLRHTTSVENLAVDINRVNSAIRGVINYYECATYVYEILRKYEDQLKYTAYKALKRRLSGRKGAKDFAWIKASSTANLRNTHARYSRDSIPAMRYQGIWIGITSLRFCKWVMTPQKNQLETPFTEEGRQLYQKRTLRKPVGIRADELLSSSHMLLIKIGMMEGRPLYNFEYFLNRAYAFNRDKGKCRVCGKELVTDVHVHHINPHLPIGQVNRVANLACMHTKCHQTVHGREPVDNFYGRMKSKIKYFRDALQK